MIAEKWATETVDRFGESIEIPELTLNQQGIVRLDIETLGTLGLELLDEAVLVYLSREVIPDDRLFANALRLCHHSEAELEWVQAALMDREHLVFMTRLRRVDFELQPLQEAIDQLIEMHRKAADFLAI